ncbi:ArsR/SmtB family transcription factor [Wukongibacter sp. M2B1]|uniref:ArsR/SmtB family transcription factor n=1 Tax=Wukongibacter sp. M2B1 TaxID=3088895 RepID=UPI003D7AB65D
MRGINKDNFDIDVIKALGDETRLEILNLLGNKEMNVNDIAQNCTVSRPTISHHLQIMKRAGLLSSRKEGKEIYYSVNINTLTSLAHGILNFIAYKTFK